MEELNMLNKPCPIPVVEAKKALEQSSTVSVLVDNFVAVQNLEKMATGLSYNFRYQELEAKQFLVVIQKDIQTNQPANQEQVAAQQLSEEKANTVILVASKTFGQGEQALGEILMKGYIYSLTQLEIPPKAVVFLNSGVYLTQKNANTVDDLKLLEQKGCAIVSCGTCLDFYKLKDQLGVGTVVNMYDISLLLEQAGKVIRL